MKECKCDMRTKLVGDGCDVCNPEQALEYATETIADLTKERDELAAQVEVNGAALSSLLNTVKNMRCPQTTEDVGLLLLQFESPIGQAEKALSITPSDALREIRARTLEEFADYAECSPVEWSFGARDMALHMAEAKRKG